LRLLFADSLPNQQDDYRPLPSQASTILSDTQIISQTPVREVDDILHAPFPSEPIVRSRTRMLNDTGDVTPLSSHGSSVFLTDGNGSLVSKLATAQSPKIIGGSLVDNEPKDNLDLASPAAFQFPVSSKQAMSCQSIRVTQSRASPMPRTTVDHPNSHQNALSLDTSSRHDLSPLVSRTRSATTPPPMLNMEREILTSTNKLPNPTDRTLRLNELNSSAKLLNLGTPGLKDVLKVCPFLQAAVQPLNASNLRFPHSHPNITLD
jgi:hypothetical protein